MAYHTHHTQAIVLGGTPRGEGSRVLILLTREFGLLRAVAKSAREERSKLRPGLQDYSMATVSLVRGKESWRITGATRSVSLYHALKSDRAALSAFARLAALLRRLLPGEERHPEVFDVVSGAVSALLAPHSKAELEAVEILAAARVLALLGYLRPPKAPDLPGADFRRDTLIKALVSKKALVRGINEALRESGL